MMLEEYLTLIGKVATGMVWTALCAMIVTVVCVYGFKAARSLVQNADANIEKMKRAKLFRAKPPRVVPRLGNKSFTYTAAAVPERKQKKAAQ